MYLVHAQKLNLLRPTLSIRIASIISYIQVLEGIIFFFCSFGIWVHLHKYTSLKQEITYTLF